MPSRRFVPLPSACHSFVGSRPGSVLLETARFDDDNARSYVFTHPVEILSIRSLDEVPALFAQVENSLAQGRFVAGYFAYECGYHFEHVGETPSGSPLPSAWLGVYDVPHIFDHARGEFTNEGRAERPEPFSWVDGVGGSAVKNASSLDISDCNLTISELQYASAIESIKNYIAAGDTYQVNFTDKLQFHFSGAPSALFSTLRTRQPVSYAAFLNLGSTMVLSLSPELFFRVLGGNIHTRPMKGTAQRGRTLAEDRQFACWLANDEKNRSENLMIVDLLRNDLGRICETGSVRVNQNDMFTVEKYETLLQMTSTVSGKLKPGVGWYDVFKSLFPCGSVTGAPKIRTMQIIHELEKRARGVYTGAIGFFSPDGGATFNVAIRTLVLDNTSGSAADPQANWNGTMGVGSGIVFDSVAEDEYGECRLKAEFLTTARTEDKDFQLIESMLWDGNFPLLNLHLNRLHDSAEYFGFLFDESAIRARLTAAASQLAQGIYKMRLLLGRDGQIVVESIVLDEAAGAGRVMLSPVAVSSADKFLFHKTTRRELQNGMYSEAQRHGCDDVIFRNERGEITEGAISNVFIEKDGCLYTPPVSCGLLPGIYRQHVLTTDSRAQERILKPQDVENADAIYICNAVRGMRKVTLTKKAAVHVR